MPGANYEVRGNVMLVVGVLVAIGAVLGFVIGISYFAGFPTYDPTAGSTLIGICGVVPLVPAILLLWFGYRSRRRGNRMRDAVGYVLAYRRIRMTDLASHLKISPADAEKLVAEAIEAGHLKAFVDAATNEVVASAMEGQNRFVGSCPRCGSPVDQWYLPGEPVTCPHCGAQFAAPPPGP